MIVLVILDFVLRRTTYGRQIFAVGGGIEGARRAGISVSFDPDVGLHRSPGSMAAVGGIFLAGRSGRRDQTLSAAATS
ncbi:sugar ABC transporter permease [Streptomyces tanashiensis]